jgi:RNA polymerase sigma factor for flagellar operon FliA
MATGLQHYRPADDDGVSSQREALVLEHLPQVCLIARRIHDRVPDCISLDDLISAGVIGLIAAIDNFDPTLGVQLNTYAEHRIHGAIIDSIRETDWAPRQTRKRSKLIEGAIHQAKQRYGREPAEEEIAAELNVTVAEYQKWLAEVQSVELERLEFEPADSPGRNLLRFVSSGEDSWPSHLMERAELVRIMALAIERMPKSERTVLSLYYYEELNLREIGEVMGMHLSRVAQLRTQAILRLRSHMERVWFIPPRRKV